MRRISVLFFMVLAIGPTINSQVTSESLKQGKTIERSLSAGQVHGYTISLEKEQFVQLAVEQHEVDVVIRVFSPDGKMLRQFDSPNGNAGTEYAEVITENPGTYRIEVTTAEDADDSSSGKYELKIIELRKATEEELRLRKNENTRKAKGLVLLEETSQNLDHFHRPETRVTMRIRAAQLWWPLDEKKASTLMEQAIEGVRQLIADNSNREQDYGNYQFAMMLRRQVINALAPHDPEAALKFLQSTRPSDDVANQYAENEQEIQLESSLIGQFVAADPKRAFELAEDLLKRSSSQSLIQTLTRLASKDRELASRLAHDIAKKVEAQDFIKSPEYAYLSTSLLQTFRTIPTPGKQEGANTRTSSLLSDGDFRDLVLKIISELLSYSGSEQSVYTPEYAVVRSLASLVGQMESDVKAYAPDRLDAINKRVSELVGSTYQPGAEWQRYQTAINKEPLETVLESVEQAPPPMRDYLYQQVVTRVAATGDVARAQQIVSERVTSPAQRKQLLHTLQEQAVTSAAEKGKFDEALRLLSKFQPSERTQLVIQIADHIGPGVKKSQAVQYLEQAKNLITMSVRAEDSEQMQALLTIARALGRPDISRSFQIVEPLIDQFNEICAAAVTMNGFGHEYYVEGELNNSEQNPVAEIADQLSETLATLAMYDFDRAKRDAEGINRLDARLRTFLMIAEHTLEVRIEPDESDVGRDVDPD